MRRRDDGEAATVAFALLLGQLASFLHLAVAPHAICLEHGEIVERAHAALASAVSSDQSSESTIAAGEAEHDHDRCLAASVENDAANVSAPVRLSPRAGTTRALLPIAGASSLAAAPLYRLAPKTSPPA
jgi:hypothetical protein